MARFFRRGVSKVYFKTSLLTPLTGLTQAEITASTNLTNSVAEIGGFQLSNSPIATPDLESTFTKTIIGEDTTDASTITFYDDDASSTIRSALAKGTGGYIILAPYGSATSKRVEIWAVRSTGVNDEWTIGNDPARFMVGFAVTEVPAQGGAIAA